MEKYKISNHLIFALVMQDKKICKRFLERIFDGKVIKELYNENTGKVYGYFPNTEDGIRRAIELAHKLRISTVINN